MGFKGLTNKTVSSSYLFTQLQLLYTKIKSLIVSKADVNHTHSEYVPTSGGIITGNLQVTEKILGEDLYTNHAIDIGHNGENHCDFYECGGEFNFYQSINGENTLLGKITPNGWEGNISGSVDNADKIDGYHADDFLLNKHHTIDLTDSSYDQNTYYPVTSLLDGNIGYNEIKVDVALNSNSYPTWSTHVRGFTVHFDILNISSGWGVSTPTGILLNSDYLWCSSMPVGYSQLYHSSEAVLYLRGGGRYFVTTNYNTTWEIRTSAYTNIGGTVTEPTTTYPGIIINRATISADLSGNATTASTANQVSIVDATTNAARNVWFSDASNVQKACKDDGFKYNPSNNELTVGSITGMSNSSLSIADYNEPNNKIQIGWHNAGLTNPSYVAGYWVDNGIIKIKDVSISNLRNTLQPTFNADTVDGFHVSMNNNYGLKPIGFGTYSLTPGVTALTYGNVYMQYE